jgi:hypothetical protein
MDALRKHPKIQAVWQNDSNRTIGRKWGAGKYRPKGLPDIVGVLKDARAFFIEVKTQTGKIQDHQQDFIDHVFSIGCPAKVCRSVDEALELISCA